MLTIAFFDEKNEIKAVENLLDKWSIERQVEIKKKGFYKEEDLLNYFLIEDNNIDIVILNIQISEINGIETATKLRIFNKECLIILFSNSCSNVFDGYRIKAFRYILKHQFKNDIIEALDGALEEITDKETYFSYSANKKTMRVCCKNILYFESKQRKIIIFLKDQKENKQFYGRISDVEKDLVSRYFIRCHQSFIVNMKYIDVINGRNLIFKTGIKTIPISKRYIKSVNNYFLYSIK